MTPTEKPHVLAVEDLRIVARDLRLRLQRMGYRVTLASSGEEAIRLAESERPQVAVLDIVLNGGMDGIEAAERLQAGLAIPVVSLTAHADEATVERARRVGPVGYVLKPFEDADLAEAIDRAVAARAALAPRHPPEPSP